MAPPEARHIRRGGVPRPTGRRIRRLVDRAAPGRWAAEFGSKLQLQLQLQLEADAAGRQAVALVAATPTTRPVIGGRVVNFNRAARRPLGECEFVASEPLAGAHRTQPGGRRGAPAVSANAGRGQLSRSKLSSGRTCPIGAANKALEDESQPQLIRWMGTLG